MVCVIRLLTLVVVDPMSDVTVVTGDVAVDFTVVAISRLTDGEVVRVDTVDVTGWTVVVSVDVTGIGSMVVPVAVLEIADVEITVVFLVGIGDSEVEAVAGKSVVLTVGVETEGKTAVVDVLRSTGEVATSFSEVISQISGRHVSSVLGCVVCRVTGVVDLVVCIELAPASVWRGLDGAVVKEVLMALPVAGRGVSSVVECVVDLVVSVLSGIEISLYTLVGGMLTADVVVTVDICSAVVGTVVVGVLFIVVISEGEAGARGRPEVVVEAMDRRTRRGGVETDLVVLEVKSETAGVLVSL